MDTSRPMTFRTRHGRFTVRRASLVPSVMRYVRALDAAVERRECGANAEGGGGFQPGNKCAKGGDSSDGGVTTQAKASRQLKGRPGVAVVSVDEPPIQNGGTY